MVKKIIIVGGGVGGTLLANQLVTKLYPEIGRRGPAGPGNGGKTGTAV